MKVLMLSTDASILLLGSPARERMRAYSDIVEKVHVVVVNRRMPREGSAAVTEGEAGRSRIRVGRRLMLYPTNSCTKAGAFFDALRIAREVLPRKQMQTKKNWLITAQDPFETGLVGWLLSARRGIALEIQAHTDMESPFFRRESLTNALRLRIARFLLARARGVRVVSERIRQAALSRTKHPPEVFPVFVDVASLRALPLRADMRKKYPQFDFLVLAASRLTREKDIGTMLEAMSLVLAKYPKTGLLVVGDGPERRALLARAAVRGLEDSVKFLGWQDDLVSYYRSADAYLLTSLYEGYGRTLIEAASLGCPVITSDVGLAGEVFKDKENALVCPVRDAACFAGNIIRLREDEPLKRALVVRAEQAVNGIALTKEEYLKQCSKMWHGYLREPL